MAGRRAEAPPRRRERIRLRRHERSPRARGVRGRSGPDRQVVRAGPAGCPSPGPCGGDRGHGRPLRRLRRPRVARPGALRRPRRPPPSAGRPLERDRRPAGPALTLRAPRGRAGGVLLESFDLDFLRARVPPDSTDRPIPQQLLLFDIADQAARDARLQPGASVAVVVAVEAEVALHRFRGRVDLEWQLPRLLEHLDVELSPAERAALTEEAKGALHDPAQVNQYVSFIGNVIACRVASRWDFDGPAFTVSAGELSAYRALELARDLLESGEVEAVIVAAVDLAGGLEAVLARSWTDVDGAARVGEGAGAMVPPPGRGRAGHAGLRLPRRTVDPAAEQRRLDPEAPVAAAAAGALAAAGASAADIGYLELGWSGVAGRDGPELRGLARAYAAGGQGGEAEATCAVGSATHIVGDTRAASGIAGLIHAALCLSGRRLPPSPELPDDGSPSPWSSTAWHVGPRARPWLRPGAQATTRGCQRHRRRRRGRARGHSPRGCRLRRT